MYTELFLEGHGAGSIAALGALDALIASDAIDRPRVHCYSMGSVIAVALALGSTPAQILAAFTASPLLGSTGTHLIFSMLTWRGRATTMRRIRAVLFALGVTRGLTFAALRETGWDVRVLVASLATRGTLTFDAGSTPRARVLDAVVASCSIPGFLNTGALVDGGTFGGFCDARIPPEAVSSGALVLAVRSGRIFNTKAHPATRLLAAYRALTRKLGRRWMLDAQAAGATVLHVPHGCALAARADRVRATYDASRAWAAARSSARRAPETVVMPV